MDDFTDRSISELIESIPLFLEAMKDEYDILLNMINIIFSSCSIITKTEIIGRYYTDIECEVFPSFFEYQIYKIMEKYSYYYKIRRQYHIIRGIYIYLRPGDPKLKEYDSLDKRCDCIIYIRYEKGNEVITIYFENKIYSIIIEDKYKPYMLNLFDSLKN